MVTSTASQFVPPSGNPPSRFGTWISSEASFVFLATLAGGILRFAWLSWPTLWNDEVMTYSRVCGTHQQMLDILRDDAFGPLHYEIYWWLGRAFTLTPFAMRIVPALAGTLMVPAMYHLGRELFGRRVGRLACVFAACSAFLLAYSRDAKMYMELWLAMTAHVACLLTCLRTREAGETPRIYLWIGWFLAGMAALWLHSLGFFIIPLDIGIVLLQPSSSLRRTALILVALLAMLVGPLRYVVGFTRVPADLHRRGWDATGIVWVNERTAGHSPGALLADTASAFAFGFSWIEQPNGRARLSSIMMVLSACLTSALGILLAWSMLRQEKSSKTPGETIGSTAIDSGRGVFLLSAWIVVPIYAAYRISSIHSQSIGSSIQSWCQHAPMLCGGMALMLIIAAAIASMRWGRQLLTLLSAPLVAITVGVPIVGAFLFDSSSPVRAPPWLNLPNAWGMFTVVAIACAVMPAWFGYASMPRTPFVRRLLPLAPMGGVIVLCVATDALVDALPRNAVWMPRYLGFVYPAVLVGAAALVLRLPSLGLRSVAIVGILGVNLATAGAHLFASSEPPLDLVATDVVSSLAPNADTLVYTPDTTHTFGPNAVGSMGNTCGLYYLVIASGKHLTPHQFRQQSIHDHFFLRSSADPRTIQQDTRLEPEAKHIVIWARADKGERESLDLQMQRCLPDWRLESTIAYPVRSFWNWGDHYTYSRMVYGKSKAILPASKASAPE
jgi:4-amino-4-deoxy-L-arabinose transferase-like glycosyltransferase